VYTIFYIQIIQHHMSGSLETWQQNMALPALDRTSLSWAGWLEENDFASARHSRPGKQKNRQTLAWAGILRSGLAHLFTLNSQ
jgi:hypothetical protein